MKFLRDNKVLIFRFLKRVYKILFSPAASCVINSEKKGIEAANQDPHFSRYLPDYKFFPGGLSLPYFKNLGASERMIQEYFQEAFKSSGQWKEVFLKAIDEFKFSLDFVKKYRPTDFKKWDAFLEKTAIPGSSCHGDFYSDNIFIEEGRLFFIDWGQYNLFSSRYFDLINFYLFSKKEENQSWTDAWKNEYNARPGVILGFNLPPGSLLAYGVWKAGRELKMLESANAMTEFKKKKFIDFFKSINLNEN